MEQGGNKQELVTPLTSLQVIFFFILTTRGSMLYHDNKQLQLQIEIFVKTNLVSETSPHSEPRTSSLCTSGCRAAEGKIIDSNKLH